ncbi:MAG: hypothetical protein Q9164_004621 [Protoblastenia rupestris]
MLNSQAILAIAVFTGLTLANTGCKVQPNSSPNPSGNPVITPGKTSIVPVGALYDITWQPTTTGTVSIVLLRGPADFAEPFDCIVDSVANTGSYAWTPSNSLENDKTGYGIKIIDDSTGDYQYSTQFGISNTEKKAESTSQSASSPYTSTTTKSEQNTRKVYETQFHSTTGTAPLSTHKSETKSKFTHLAGSTPHVSNFTVKPTHYSSSSSYASAPTVISEVPAQNKTSTYAIQPTKPITKPSSLGPVQTSIAVETGAVPDAPTTTETPAAPATPTPELSNGAVGVAAGGVLAGLGALAAFVL